MDFKTVAMKENTIITAVKDDAADRTENDDAIKSSNTKTKRPFMKSYIFTWSPGVPDILENFSCGTEYLCMGYQIS